jgi:hypothetical protein
MLRKPKRSHKKLNILIAIVLLAVVAGGVFVAGRTRHWWDGSNTSSRQDDPAQPKTRTETTEGKKIEVPEDTPENAIRDYVLITEDERFKIRQSPGTDNYIITLYAIINRPDQYDMYQDQLREYKQAALDYLKGKGVNVDKVNITYEPQEATNL